MTNRKPQWARHASHIAHRNGIRIRKSQRQQNRQSQIANRNANRNSQIANRNDNFISNSQNSTMASRKSQWAHRASHIAVAMAFAFANHNGNNIVNRKSQWTWQSQIANRNGNIIRNSQNAQWQIANRNEHITHRTSQWQWHSHAQIAMATKSSIANRQSQ